MTGVMLVDDEPLARDRLRRMLEEQTEYRLLAEADSGNQAIKLAQQHKPDIILLDIRMPGMDGLEAAQHLTQMAQPPAIIFCTAYDEYAIDAFDVQAVGYVLKPVDKEQLLKALARAKAVSRHQLQALTPNTTARTHLSVKTHGGVELLPLDEISHFMAEQKYVVVHCQEREHLLEESLKQLEQEFGKQFLRIHRNCLVSLSHIEKLVRSREGQNRIKLKGQQPLLGVSRRHLTAVKKVLKTL